MVAAGQEPARPIPGLQITEKKKTEREKAKDLNSYGREKERTEKERTERENERERERREKGEETERQSLERERKKERGGEGRPVLYGIAATLDARTPVLRGIRTSTRHNCSIRAPLGRMV